MSTVLDEKVQAGREALERHAWQEAFDALSEADVSGTLDAEALKRLGEAAWWAGQLDCMLNALERAYRLYLDAGNTLQAAYLAMTLARHYNDKLSASVATGWRARAERLLEKEPEAVEHGYLAMWQAMAALGQGQIDRMRERAERAIAIAERFADRDLWALGTHMLGRATLAQGSVEEGLFLMDEVTAAAVGNELSTEITGVIYCWTISTCRDLADVKRAAEWTEAAKRWCERQSITGFPGICRIHRAEIMRLRGVWGDAELEAVRASQELPAYSPRMAGAALAELGELRLRMGDLIGAEEAFDQAADLGTEPEPGRSVLLSYQGDGMRALRSLQEALDDSRDRLHRARLLPAMVEVALAAGETERAAAAAGELEGVVNDYGGTLFEASALHARGAVQLAQGDAVDAARNLRRALRLWQGLDAPYEVAQVRTLMGLAHQAAGEGNAAITELRAAQTAFERLGAARDAQITVERLELLVRPVGPGEEPAAPHTTRAFLFTDIVRSTDLIQVIGDEAWHSLVRWHDRTLRAIFKEHGGQEVEHRGDGFFVSFGDAPAAVACAIAVQRCLAEHRHRHGFSPKVRAGVHLAEAVRVGTTYQGKGVHEAARIAALAEGDEILMSTETLEAAGPDIHASVPRTVQLKGFSKPIEVRAVEWMR
jgi:class 3 adenylate cyclase